MRSTVCNLAAWALASRLGGYLAGLTGGLAILWCYFLWYLMMVCFYFQPSLSLWLNSLGLSLVVGAALILATGPLNLHRIQTQFWQVVRLVLCPFCVSSFTALTAGQGFLLLLSPSPGENLQASALCAVFLSIVYAIKFIQPKLGKLVGPLDSGSEQIVE